MSRKHFQIAMRLLCGLSFMWLLGVAGDSDLGEITIRAAVAQGLLATAAFGITAYWGGLIK